MYCFSFTNQRKRRLKTALSFRYKTSSKTVWRLKNEGLTHVVRSILPVINRANDSSWPQNLQLLKGEKGDRLVFRINPSPINRESFVVKICPFILFKHKLEYTLVRHYIFGMSEAANLITAAERGLSVPKVYGYGWVYNSFGLIKMSIVILEDLNHHSPVDEFLVLNRGNEQKCAKILGRTIPVFVSFYKAGCNNIDINLHSIMLSDNGSNPDAFALDFEGAKFHNKPRLEILMFEAAYFVRWSPLLTEPIINNWLAKLFDAINAENNDIREKLTERFNYYRATKLHRKKRRKIH